MYQIYYFVFVAFFVDNLQFTKSQSCNEEVHIVDETNVTWSSSETSLSVVSDPLCVDKNNILVTRKCVNGQWLPNYHIIVKDCVSVQTPFHPECRSGDKKIKKTGTNTDYCLYITEEQQWKAELPVFDIEDVRNFLDNLNLTEQYIWLPVHRTEKYGKFIWMVPTNYSKKFNSYYLNNKAITKYEPYFVSFDCMICYIRKIHVCTYYPENCKKNRRTVHVYNPEIRYFVKYENITYSTMNNNAYFVARDCEKLAQPTTKADNFAIKTLIANRTCRIGIERDKKGAFIWQNTSNFINYTDWIPSTNFNNSVVAITKDGWHLETQINNIECSVCEIDQTTYKTELTVQPNKNYSKLVVTTYSHQKLMHLTAHTNGLEDINIGNDYTRVDNEDTNVQYNFNKLDIRRVSIVNLTNMNSNYYYFTAIILPKAKKIKTNKIFLSDNKPGLEYAFKLKIETLCTKTFICDPHLNNFYTNISNFLLLQTNNLPFNQTSKLSHIVNITNFRPIEILKINDKGDIKMLFHLRTNGTVENIREDYEHVKILLKILEKQKLFYLNHTLSIEDDFKSCRGCVPQSETFRNRTVMWEFTDIGKSHTPLKSCTNSEFLITRECKGDYLNGAKWKDPKIIFNKTDQHSIYTEKFCNLYQNRFNSTQTEVFRNLSKLTRNLDLKAADILYVSKIMQNAPDPNIIDEDKKSLAESFSLIMNNMIAVNISSLKEANQKENSTNELLAAAAKRLQDLTENDLDSQGKKQLVHDNFLFHTVDPFVSGITGLALISPSGIDNPSFSNYIFKDITANMSIEEIISWENLETAIYVPNKLLEDIRNHSNIHNTTVRISISFYYNDSLFNENNNNTSNETQLASRVFDVTIKGYENYLYSALPVITKLKMNTSEALCAYWVFGSPTNNVTSGWAKEYNNSVRMNDNTIQICNYSHLTNFAMLLGKRVDSNTTLENKILELVTMVGCLLSTIGICGIFLTAMIFKSWRLKVGTKVLLNVSGCILLQIVLLYLNMKYTEILCIITGTLLHYSILCGFSWSLIMAVLQYLRFVRVMGGPTAHLLLKASVVGWILPIIPVTISLVVNHVKNNKYVANLKELGSNICYPQDMMLYLTLLLPVSLIVLANLIIFILILYNISRKTSIPNTNNSKQMRFQQLKLAILLFFLLGLTWIVGLVSVVHNSIAFLYFFCATATMQGFILFLFYVVLDKGTCGLWYKMLKSKVLSTKKMSQSQQTTIPTAESNTYNTTKEESGTSLTEVADWNTRVQVVMQQLEGTHRVDSGVRSKHQVMS